MQLLDLTLPTPEENLALDEALLADAESAAEPVETLRLWESPAPAVVVGRSSRIEREVNVDACRRDGVPILRRSSGGAAIVAGPGCLMYAVVLRWNAAERPGSIHDAHRMVLDRMRAIASAGVEASHVGTSDLAFGDRKFSGNSLRCKRRSLLYHGTLLYDFDLDLITTYLAHPPRQPAYRADRSHGEFVTNLPVAVDQLRAAIAEAWGAVQPRGD